MNASQIIFLGLIQGLTEFLPVSSSGHLVLAEKFLGINQGNILLEVILHLGTTLAILVYFRKSLLKLIQENFIAFIIASIPAAFFGLIFRGFLESLFASTLVVSIGLLLTAVFNYFTDKAQARREKLNVTDAIIIGIAQALAIVPGVSRSGSTIFAGTSSGLDRKKAAEFSFVLSVPAVLGANFIEILSHGMETNLGIGLIVLGVVTSFVSGLFAVSMVLRFLQEKRFIVFAVYAFLLATLALLVSL